MASLASAANAIGNLQNYSTTTASTLTINGAANTTFGLVIGRVATSDGGDGVVNLVRAGSGSTTLTAANTYTGTTTVSGGTLLVNGSHTGGGAYTVNGGILGGTGTIAATVTNNAGGTVAPGVSPGTLTIAGDYTNLGTLEIELAGLLQGSEYDLLRVQDGDAILGGILAVELLDGFRPLRGTTFEVLTVSNGSLIDNGIVLGGPDGSWFSLEFDTQGGRLLLTSQIPEPASALLLALGLLGLRRRRR